MTKIRKVALFEKPLVLIAVAFLLVGLLSEIPSHTARADTLSAVVRIDCMPELGILSVSEDTMRGKRAFRSLLDQPEKIAAKYGYHNV